MSNFEKLVNARMAKTGENWQTAQRAVRAQVVSPVTVSVEPAEANAATVPPMVSMDPIDGLLTTISRAPAPAAVLRFVGYGRQDAPLWFIGFEEGVGERTTHPHWSARWEVEQRSTWRPVMDARIAHEHLRDPYWETQSTSSVWTYAAKLARGILDGAEDFIDLNLAKRYVTEQLGRERGLTLLGEVLPLPAKGLRSWPAEYAAWYTDRDRYRAAVEADRLTMWRELVRQYEPRCVICYGTGKRNEQWRRYEQIFASVAWTDLDTRRVKVGSVGRTRVYLAPFFGQGQIGHSDIRAIVQDARAAAGRP